MSVNEMTTTAREFREIQAQIKTLEEMADALKQQMIREMDTRNIEELNAGEYIQGTATSIWCAIDVRERKYT